MKVLNPINHYQINKYLLDSLAICPQIEDFCRNCQRILAEYIEIRNFILYQYDQDTTNIVYQNHSYQNNGVEYPSVLYTIAKKVEDNLNQGHIATKDIYFLWEQNIYEQWLKQENINYLFMTQLKFKKELSENLFIEIKSYKYPCKDVQEVLSLVNRYLSIYCYQNRLEEKEQKFIVEAAEIEKTKQEQSRYLSHMNHELRTPIAAVIGFAKMLQQKMYGELNVKQAQYVDAIYQSGTYLLELISDLLDVSKIQAHKEELFIEKTLVRELCESALSLVQTKAEEQGLELTLIVKSQVQSCFVDQRRLKQVLVNLLSNAVKFTEKGSVTLKVNKDEKYIYFQVIDTGIGVDAKSQRKLFQPFSQLNTHLHRQHKGTGLGLVISRELARLHGGDITLESEQNKGSCFTVIIPHHCQQME